MSHSAPQSVTHTQGERDGPGKGVMRLLLHALALVNQLGSVPGVLVLLVAVLGTLPRAHTQQPSSSTSAPRFTHASQRTADTHVECGNHGQGSKEALLHIELLDQSRDALVLFMALAFPSGVLDLPRSRAAVSAAAPVRKCARRAA